VTEGLIPLPFRRRVFEGWRNAPKTCNMSSYSFGAFRADYKADPKRLDEYYVMTNWSPGHFSELGNRRIAETVAAALADDPVLAERP